ncbi:hypothetical protein M405DRAFT_547646 [Rhizopogon salebrosus TDB-379]|nr:hypothetical protein M405DRAFT_547646 [Rhizopogon salebrosus TDB-379]
MGLTTSAHSHPPTSPSASHSRFRFLRTRAKVHGTGIQDGAHQTANESGILRKRVSFHICSSPPATATTISIRFLPIINTLYMLPTITIHAVAGLSIIIPS